MHKWHCQGRSFNPIHKKTRDRNLQNSCEHEHHDFDCERVEGQRRTVYYLGSLYQSCLPCVRDQKWWSLNLHPYCYEVDESHHWHYWYQMSCWHVVVEADDWLSGEVQKTCESNYYNDYCDHFVCVSPCEYVPFEQHFEDEGEYCLHYYSLYHVLIGFHYLIDSHS